MKTKAFRILLAILFLGITACKGPDSQKETHDTLFQEGSKHILIMHPTVNNLEIFRYLTESGVFPLPADYRVVGVYHNAGAYDYGQSHDYILKEELENFALLGLEQPLTENTLWQQNALSPYFQSIFEQSEGVIFFGGPDIPPAIYGEPTSLLTVITDPHRHYLEASFLFHLLGGYQDEAFTPLMKANDPYRVLGICLGMQTMNIATGGTMIQDIPFEVYGLTTVEEVLAQDNNLRHRNYLTHLRHDPGLASDSYHIIQIEPRSLMQQIAGDETITPVVLSSHHQAAREIGKGWRVTAWCADKKIVEALEHERFPNVLGVQFHPERIKIFDGSPLKKLPHVSSGKSYPEHFPAEKGEDFHRNFWIHIADMYP